jgi:hypothetical protein
MQALTPSAREELELYFQEARPRVIASGADPDEVEADLRRRLEEELGPRPAGSVDIDALRVLLVRFGPLGFAPAALPPLHPPRKGGGFGQGVFWFFGVVLPLVTTSIEAMLGWSAQDLFDPIPTPIHVLLCLLVPAAQWTAWRALRRSEVPGRLALAANGVAVGISLFYTVLYLPLVPLAVVAIVFFGAGLLPLTPILSLVTALVLRRKLRRRAREAGVPAGAPFWSATAAAFAVLLALELPRTLTRFAAGYAAEGGPAERAAALGVLRTVGSRDALLRLSYVRTSMGVDMLGSLFARPIAPRQARTLYFRVTGRPFNSVPPPRLRAGRGSSPLGMRGRDDDRGGSAVSEVVDGLSLSSSRVDGSVDAAAALAYVEWTLELRNDTAEPQEARAQIALPPGAVVSRLTLWIDGEEREAAFAGRSQTRQAYEAVVRQRRDPVLVTTSGPDRVLVQCFPVPPGGGTMKARVGITAPLDLATVARGRLVLPRIVERNFAVPDALRHAVWVEATGAVSGAGLAQTARPEGVSLRGALTDAQLLAPEATLSIGREAAPAEAWALDAREPERPALVRQRLELKDRPAAPLVLVVDGSIGVARDVPALARALDQAPAGTVVAVLVAGDDLLRFNDPAGRGGSWGTQLGRAPFVGGQDSVPALEAAWDEAEQRNAVVVWIHGPQPVGLAPTDALRQRWERRPDGPRMLSFPLAPGANRVLEALDGVRAVSAVVREGDVETDLVRLLESWSRPTSRPVATRLRVDEAAPSDRASKTSDHLVRLWARDETERLAAVPDTLAAATELAAAYRLVTPVTGAVVLETAAQYEAAGLTPGSAANVPTIPEPETWALLALALCAAAYAARRRRSGWTAA